MSRQLVEVSHDPGPRRRAFTRAADCVVAGSETWDRQVDQDRRTRVGIPGHVRDPAVAAELLLHRARQERLAERLRNCSLMPIVPACPPSPAGER